MSRPIERLFAMDEMIRSGEYPSIADFMRRFAIQERAAYGDVQYLKRRFHAPIQYSKRQGGYFYTLIGWSLTNAETPTKEEMNLAPTKWLWNEIARRFGQESMLTLHRDFYLQQEYEQRRQSRRNPSKTCPRCGVRISKTHRCLAERKPLPPLICVQCGKPFDATPHTRMRRYCDDCTAHIDIPLRSQYDATEQGAQAYRRAYNTHYQRRRRSSPPTVFSPQE